MLFFFCSLVINRSPPISQGSVFKKFKEHVNQQKFSSLGRIFFYKKKNDPQKLVEKHFWTSLKPFNYEEITGSSHIVK